MAFNIAGFLVGRVLAERQGISDDAVLNRLAIVGGIMGTSPTGIVMTSILAQREAENNIPPPVTPDQTIQVEVPEVTELTFREARKRLESLGLLIARQDLYSMDTAKDHVISQNPEAKAIVLQGAEIMLAVSLGSELPAPTCPPTAPKTAVASGEANATK